MDNRIFKYFSDLMTEDQKQAFLNEVNESDQLKTEFEKVSVFLKDIKSISESEPDNNAYFNNLVVQVHSRLEKKSRRLKKFVVIPRYTALVIPLLVLFIIFNPFKKSQSSFEEVISSYDDSTQQMLLYSLNETSTIKSTEKVSLNSDDLINEEISSELETAFVNNGHDIIRTDDLLNDLSEEEANKIYSELINKKFF